MNRVESPLELTLYGTCGCHLCTEAGELLDRCLDQWPVPYNRAYCDIAGDEGLVLCYGTRIPVIRERVTGTELGWPFDYAALQAWLCQCRNALTTNGGE